MSDEQLNTRKEILELLKDTLGHYATYHNHKENVAWAGVAFFAALAIGAATVMRDRLSDLSCASRAALSLVVVGACAVCSVYVSKQFALRKRAADLVAASIQLRARLTGDPSAPLNLPDWQPPSGGISSGMQSTHVLPKAILLAADSLGGAGQSSRKTLETCAYALLLGIALLLLALIWTVG